MLFFLLAFPILGAGIKYIDDAFDEKIFNKKIAYVIAPFLGILWAYTMVINTVAATILLAVLCGVFFKGKIDNLAHLAGLGVILAIIVIAGVQLMILPLLLLAGAALLDEVGNDTVDKNRDKLDESNFSHRFLMYFFDHRWTLKAAILVISLAGVIPLYFFLAMIFFDESYVLMRWYGELKQKGKITPSVLLSGSEIAEKA